ncbi:unnamed protein product [Gongylonema pulchrum]|uniref:Uncharacterized protein n=1 Tax=Gongylonema pulchrum TaxID=637853 RepID=A0A183DTP1_9BILA|nr:unnamed protein product [Gongylonema pulchrum]
MHEKLPSGLGKKAKQEILEMLEMKKKDIRKVAKEFDELLAAFENWRKAAAQNLVLAFDAYMDAACKISTDCNKLIESTFGKQAQNMEINRFLKTVEQSRVPSLGKLSTGDARLTAIAIAAVEVYEYSIQPFEAHYGMKREQLYILIRAPLRFYNNVEYECWCIPLRAVDDSKPEPIQFDLFLIRPRRKGEVIYLQKRFDEYKLHELLSGIDSCKVAEHTILVPQVLLPCQENE